MRFLDSMAPNWNISLCHYRSQGGDVGRILIGLQVPPDEMGEFAPLPRPPSGYRYWDESSQSCVQAVSGVIISSGHRSATRRWAK